MFFITLSEESDYHKVYCYFGNIFIQYVRETGNPFLHMRLCDCIARDTETSFITSEVILLSACLLLNRICM